MAMTFRGGLITATLALLLSVSFGEARSQAKWWWEKYPSASDKTLGLTNSLGASVDTKVNATGNNASVSGNAATQPPTVIIQQTASSTGVSMPTMTCFQPSSMATYTAQNYYGATLGSCPSVPGFNVTTMMGTNSPAATYYNGSQWTNSVILGCCYVPLAPTSPTPNGASFSPWANFGDSGYTGTQHTAFTTPGSSTFNIPSGVFRVWVTVVGGGGGGAGNSGSSWGGGSGGILYRYPIDVMPNDTMQIVVGAGGGGGNAGTPGSGLYPGAAGNPSYHSTSAAGGGGSSAVRYNTLVAGAGGGSGSVSPAYWNGGTGYGTGAGLAGPGQSTSLYGGSGFGSNSFTIKPGGTAGNATGGSQFGAGGYNANVSAYGGSPCGGGGGWGYGNGAGGGVGVAVGNACISFAASGQGGNGGGSEGPTGYGGGGSYSTGAGKPLGSAYPGGGGAAGFIGMSWSTGVPSAESGKCPYGYGSGGYGYGAGGGGSLTGYASCTSVATAAGGKGADGAVFVEW